MEKIILENKEQIIDILRNHPEVAKVYTDNEDLVVETKGNMYITINLCDGVYFCLYGKISKAAEIENCFNLYLAIYERYDWRIEPTIFPIDDRVEVQLRISSPEIEVGKFTTLFDYVVDMYADCVSFIFEELNNSQSDTTEDSSVSATE